MSYFLLMTMCLPSFEVVPPSYQADCKASLLGRLLLRGFALRHLVPPVSNRELKFVRTERGRPVVAGDLMGALDYNVSHSGDWVVLAGGGTTFFGLAGRRFPFF